MIRAALIGAALTALFVSGDCTFLNNPDEYLRPPSQRWRELTNTTTRVNATLWQGHAADRQSASSSEKTPRKNFIDEYVFGKMEQNGISPAPLSSDQEFFRRVYLDLTGRIPSADQAAAFASDTDPAKRDAVIDSLVGSPEFVDKWTMFLGDLFRNNGPATNVNRYNQGRDAFYRYIRDSLAWNTPYNEMAQEMISATGDSWENGAANFPVGGTVPMGPQQDTYDGQAVDVAQMFLGINVVDCILCHDGARHLDSLSLWGARQTRAAMWGMSAFFARTRMQPLAITGGFEKYIVTDLPAGDYELNTSTGNRSPRSPADGVMRVAPAYPFTGEPAPGNGNRRMALASFVTADPQFARAAVNYVWEQFMVEALVSPSNAFDLARLDPANPPEAPWTLQPSNPELLEALASWFRDNGYDLRQLMALIARSNAYQLSSAYPGVWRPEYVPYYARKYPRRLYAEEIHDAVTRATGILPRYTLEYQGSVYPLPAVNWAMQFPDTRGGNSQGAQFLNAFGRGDRDLTPRDTNGSALQALTMMNLSFVMTRIHENNNGSNVQRLLREETEPERIIEGLYLATLSRFPDSQELNIASGLLRSLGNQRGAEAVQWALLNKLEFIFSY